jgi:hypothetical protein
MRVFFVRLQLAMALTVFWAGGVFAQMERTVYQTFSLDSVTTFQLDVVGFTEVEVKTWAGNTVLSEVQIQLWDASPEILNFMVDNGRYRFLFDKKGSFARIASEQRDRKLVKTKLSNGAACQEITRLRIFLPDTYGWDPTLDAGSDGVLKENTDALFRWVAGSEEVVSQEQQNKYTLIKTFQLKSR